MRPRYHGSLIVFPTRGAAIQFMVPRGLDLDIKDHQVVPWVTVLAPNDAVAAQAEAFISGLRFCCMDTETRSAVQRNISNI